MARVSLIPKIGLGTEKINSQFKVSSKSLLETQKSVTNINKLLTNRIKVRKEIFSKIYETKKRREFDTRRQELEDEREARNTVVSGAIDNITSSISKTGGSLIGRLLKALGFIVAGWILRSLPTWIGYAKEFIARINELGRIIRSFISNVGNIFQSTGNLLRAAKENILKLDFFDSERNLRNSFSELGKSIEGVQKDFEDTINVFTTDITKEIDGVKVGSYSGEAIPEPGTGFTEDPTTPPQTYDSGPSSSGGKSGTKEQRALLGAISFAEGTPSYGTIYGGAVVPELARGELTVKQVYDMMMSGKLNGRNVGYKSGSRATGKYQFMPDTLSDIVKTGAISWNEKFTPEAQDRAILARISSFRGVTPELLAKEGISKNVVDKLAPEFASFPNLFGPDAAGRVGTNTSYYGQGGKKYEEIVREYNKSLQSQQNQQPSQPAQRAAPTGNASASLAQAAQSLKGMSSSAGPGGGNLACVWAVNQVFKRAGLKTPWGDSNYVPTAEEQMIKAGYIKIPIGQQKAGDLYIVHGQAHIGIVLANGNIISNSSSGAKFSWEASLSSYQKAYGGPGRFYRIPGVSSTQQAQQSTTSLQRATVTPTESIIKGKRSAYEGSSNVVSTGYKDASGRDIKLNPGAAQAFKQMIADGMPFSSGDVKNVYRDENEYLRLKSQGYEAASNSKHNFGMAADIHGAMNTWIRKNGAKYGWYANDYSRSHGGHFEWRGKANVSPQQPSQQAQISPAPTQQAQQQVAQQITPERKAQDIVAVVPSPTPQQPAVSQGPAPSQQQTAPSMGELLNNFIKQKFLLDLSFL